MSKRVWTVFIVLIAAGTSAAEDGAKTKITPAQQLEVIEKVKPLLARVEYTLRYDKGEAPRTGGYFDYGFSPYEFTALRYHDWDGGSDYVSEERPMEVAAYVLDATSVITSDKMIHPRFIKAIHVRYGDQLVEAEVTGVGETQNAVRLKLAEPLAGVRPMKFDASAEPPHLAVGYARTDGVWTVGVEPMSRSVGWNERGEKFMGLTVSGLITDKAGTPVTIIMTDRLPVDETWKTAPDAWSMTNTETMRMILDSAKKRADKAVVRVALNFRSPKKTDMRSMWMDEEEEEEKTQRSVLGVLVDAKRVLVLTNLKPSVTARLEKIAVYQIDGNAEGEAVPAAFTHTLKDYGGFLAELEKPLTGTAVLSKKDILDLRDGLHVAADIVLQGENRVDYYQHARLDGVEIGWKQHLYPSFSGGWQNTFVFDSAGELIALPIERRKKVTVREQWDYEQQLTTAAMYLHEVLANPTEHSDSNNVPLSEEEENRLAWVGVELQALDRDLARANEVSHLTNDGQSGALVTYVYDNSPAAEVGIEPGAVFLRLHVEEHPKPLDVLLDQYAFGFGMDFPWDQWDEIPEQYFDQIPTPWPNVNNAFNQALTELGFGTPYRLEIVVDGKTQMKDLEVAESPRHYDSANRYKDETLGLTLRDLTYEVRRYFQKAEGDPGVIVSKIEPGSKASVAGLKPYEIITAVNDQALKTVKEFEKLIADKDELRLSVTRMTRSRVVKIKVDREATAEEGEESKSE